MAKTYHIITFGCQMNERDSETLAGMLEADGFVKTEEKETADVVILNTCSVRENADKKFFGVLGQLKHPKEDDPTKTVCVCGCMMQQQHVIDTLKQKYPWVDLVFGTHNISDFPKLLHGVRWRWTPYKTQATWAPSSVWRIGSASRTSSAHRKRRTSTTPKWCKPRWAPSLGYGCTTRNWRIS